MSTAHLFSFAAGAASPRRPVDPSKPRSFAVQACGVDVNRQGGKVVGKWQLDAFRLNPVLLYRHSWQNPFATAADTLPIGRVDAVAQDTAGCLQATITFAPAQANPLAEQAFQLWSQGALSAVSVGFEPSSVTYEAPVEGATPIACMVDPRLVELSVVPVPADATAVAQMVRQGLAGVAPKVAATWEAMSTMEKHRLASVDRKAFDALRADFVARTTTRRPSLKWPSSSFSH